MTCQIRWPFDNDDDEMIKNAGFSLVSDQCICTQSAQSSEYRVSLHSRYVDVCFLFSRLRKKILHTFLVYAFELKAQAPVG